MLSLIASLQGLTWKEGAVDDAILWELGEPTIGIEEIETIALSVSPNPATEEILVKWSKLSAGVTTIELLNAVGRSVYKTNFNGSANQYRLPVHELASGVYTLQVKTADFAGSSKIVVQ